MKTLSILALALVSLASPLTSADEFVGPYAVCRTEYRNGVRTNAAQNRVEIFIKREGDQIFATRNDRPTSFFNSLKEMKYSPVFELKRYPAENGLGYENEEYGVKLFFWRNLVQKEDLAILEGTPITLKCEYMTRDEFSLSVPYDEYIKYSYERARRTLLDYRP